MSLFRCTNNAHKYSCVTIYLELDFTSLLDSCLYAKSFSDGKLSLICTVHFLTTTVTGMYLHHHYFSTKMNLPLDFFSIPSYECMQVQRISVKGVRHDKITCTIVPQTQLSPCESLASKYTILMWTREISMYSLQAVYI